MKQLTRPSHQQDGSPLVAERPPRCPPRLVAVSLATSGLGLLYALYRGYYGFGGTAAMIGTPTSQAQWRIVNLVAAVVLLVAAGLPVAMLALWRRAPLRPMLLTLCWVVAVGCVMHGVINDTQRVLSLAGILDVRYPAAEWATLDRHAADVQDLAFNETWFLAEGFLWGVLAWLSLGRSVARRWWTGSAAAAAAALTTVGLLSAFDVIGAAVIG